MSKKALMFTVSLIVLALLVTPTIAAPAEKIPVRATQTVGNPVGGTDRWVSHDNILHSKGAIGGGEVTLYIPNQDPLLGITTGVMNLVIKDFQFPPVIPDEDATGVVINKMIWDFTSEDITGTFEGNFHAKFIGVPQLYVELHCVLQGTGDFKGQTLRLSYEGAPPYEWVGFLILPK
jgi:hypothetical protein